MSNSLCQLATDYRGTIPTGGAMCETKVDGWRALWFRGIDGKARLWSRQGQPLEGASHITRRLEAIEEAAGCRLFLDGEVQVSGTLAATKAWFEAGWRKGGNAGVLHLFDGMTEAEWRSGGTDRPLHERKAWLADLFKASEPDDDEWTWAAGSKGAPTPIAVALAADEWVLDVDHLRSEAERVWISGGEGLMLKDPCAPYVRKRVKAWLKVKHRGQFKR